MLTDLFPDLSPAHEPPRLLVVVAHPDDETFGCGSLLLAAAADGWRTTVACATRGEAGEPTPGTDLSTRTLGEVREAELRDAARLLGVTGVHLLAFGDSGMEGEPAPETLAAASPEEVRRAVDAVVAAEEPDVLVTLDGSDGHRDHVAVREATLAVARERQVPLFWHCLARSLMDRWVAHMTQVQPDLIYLRDAGLGTPDAEITLTIDTAEHYEARERAIAAHASQTSPFEGLPAELRRAFLTREHLVRAD
jgi:LmbE family N-acetylglucosaminyl deacetylase